MAETEKTLPKASQEIFDQLGSLSSAYLEVTKLKISNLEKLIVLDGATLALTVSAFSSFRSAMVGDGGIGYLLACWKCLPFAIVTALIAQRSFVIGIDSFNFGILGGRFRVLHLLQRESEKAATAKKASDRAFKRSDPHFWTANVGSSLALLFSGIGFYWLLRFLQANVQHR